MPPKKYRKRKVYREKRSTKADVNQKKAQSNALVSQISEGMSFWFRTGRCNTQADGQEDDDDDEITAIENQCWRDIRERDKSYRAIDMSADKRRDANLPNTKGDDSDDDEYQPGDDGEYDSDGENEGITSVSRGVMSKYLKSIKDRLQVECNTKERCENKWLIEYLSTHKFWIRNEASEWICERLGITHSLEGYYRDVLIWLPDEQHGVDPPCPTCQSNTSIGVHGYSDKTIAQKVIGRSDNYYLMSHRYIYHACEKDSNKAKFTYQGYNLESAKLLPKNEHIAFQHS